MILDRFPCCRLSPVDQLRACANLMVTLADCIAEERVLFRNGVRITPQICLEVLTELELVARLLDRDLRRDIMAVHDRFCETPTTIGKGRAPNPDIGRNLRFALGIVGHVVEALSSTIQTRQPHRVAEGQQIVARLREVAPMG